MFEHKSTQTQIAFSLFLEQTSDEKTIKSLASGWLQWVKVLPLGAQTSSPASSKELKNGFECKNSGSNRKIGKFCNTPNWVCM